jgi:hypothetical protein
MKALACLSVAVGVVAVAAVLGQGAELPGVILNESRRAEVLAAKEMAVAARAQARAQALDELIAGRLTLLQAADRFADLNATDPECQTAVLSTLEGYSEQERLCRQVILCVESTLQDQPARAATVLTRLQGELREQFGPGAVGI